MKIKSEYSYPCFSGECGFCPNCCQSENINNDEKESIQRAKVLKKFINQQRLEDEQNYYNKSLHKLMKQYDYRNPTDIGFMPQKKKYGVNEDYNKYILRQKNHNKVCDDQLCQLFHLSAHDNLKESYYQKLPLYSREKDNNHHLCIVCISRE